LIGSLADWATRHNISRVAAYKRIKTHNIPWAAPGKLDLDEADRIWAASLNPAKQRGGIAGGELSQDQPNLFAGLPADPERFQTRSDLGKAQLARELLRVKRERLTIDELEGKLVPLDDVRAFEAEVFSAIKGELEVIGEELMDDLAASTSPHECREMVDRRIAGALVRLSNWKPRA
jgi:hypothetical protein